MFHDVIRRQLLASQESFHTHLLKIGWYYFWSPHKPGSPQGREGISEVVCVKCLTTQGETSRWRRFFTTILSPKIVFLPLLIDTENTLPWQLCPNLPSGLLIKVYHCPPGSHDHARLSGPSWALLFCLCTC